MSGTGLAATKERKDDLATVKGEYDAVEQAMRNRGCTIPAPAPTARRGPDHPVVSGLASGAG